MSQWIMMLGTVDERLLLAVVCRRRRELDRIMGGLTRLADPMVAIPFAGALALGSVPTLTAAGRTAFGALVLSHLLVQLLKRVVSRPRPSLPVGMESLIQPPECFSFPSGHAAAGLSIYLPLAASLPGVLGIAALAVGVSVGVSRCYLGVHYPGDVAMGWLLAVLSALPFGLGSLLAG